MSLYFVLIPFPSPFSSPPPLPALFLVLPLSNSLIFCFHVTCIPLLSEENLKNTLLKIIKLGASKIWHPYNLSLGILMEGQCFEVPHMIASQDLGCIQYFR